MGRGKVEIKKIENINNRQVTFSKRRSGLMKKAHELSVLCDAEVAVIVFSSSGKLYEFSSSGMKQTLSRYSKSLGPPEATEVDNKTEDRQELDVLKDEVSKLHARQLQLMGNNLSGLGYDELHRLEHLLNEALLSVKEKKHQLLLEQFEQSRVREHRAMLENKALHRQVEELRSFLAPTGPLRPSSFQSHPVQCNSLHLKCRMPSPSEICDGTSENDGSDTTLHLGLSYDGSRKRKAVEIEGEKCSSN